MNFWQRLLFPKTASLIDRDAEIEHQRQINAKLIDAIVTARGNNPVFSTEPVGEARTKPVVATDLNAEVEDWRAEATLRENERLVHNAALSREAYEELYLMREEGVPGADALLEEADRLIEERELRAAANVATEGGVQ